MRRARRRPPRSTPAAARVHQFVARIFGPCEVVQIIRRRPATARPGRPT